MTLRMKVWIGAGITFVIGWLLYPFYVRNLEAVMERRGWDQTFNHVLDLLPDVGAATSNYLSALFQSSFWLGALMVLAAWGFLECVYAWLRKRTPPQEGAPWYQGMEVMRIKDAACAIAGILPDDFEGSERAKLIARDILHQVNAGYFPTASDPRRRVRALVVGQPPYTKREADIDENIAVDDLNELATKRGWGALDV